ncbi:MAG: hypothetical protein O2856_16450 [Planctomycetota bacterium]|nr:hypothetical protein [Planctomycetota bacterium]
MIAERSQQKSVTAKAVGSLLVFSDDWGRHPSSCQHLIRNLLDRYPVLWVNTIGTRAPRFDAQTMKRVTEKLRQWGTAKLTKGTGQKSDNSDETGVHSLRNLQVINPKMWPWFSKGRDRGLNRWLLSRQLTSLILQLPQPVVGLTSLPITADLPDALPVNRWVYYCVDDFSQWPGLDRDTMRTMDRAMIQRADSLVAVSETLQGMIAQEGRSASLLRHGVDVDFWTSSRMGFQTRHDENCADLDVSGSPSCLANGPTVVFWGVIDRRIDTASLVRLSQDFDNGRIVLIGPQQDPDPAILAVSNIKILPAQPLNALPAIAQQADVLIMPYADLPVTRAMQPLKLKEYLATGKPVVVNRLPSTEAWCDCLDVAESPQQFSRLVRERINRGIPASQVSARTRLQHESWKSKAEQLEQILKGDDR